MKKIAFVLDTIGVGGVEKAMVEILHWFDYSSYDVTLLLRDTSGNFLSQVDSRVKVIQYGNNSSREVLLNSIRKLDITTALPGIFYRILARLCKDYNTNEYFATRALPYIDDTDYDCVIGFQILRPENIATTLYRTHGKKKCTFVHGRSIRPKALTRFFDKIYNRFDCIFCVSEATKADFCSDFPKCQKTIVMHNLINKKEIVEKSRRTSNAMAEDQISIATVGRLSSEKGQQMVPRTARLLLDAGYDITWYLVGDGPLREEVELEIAKYNLEGRVILLGTQMNPYPFIKNCTIYVQPSFSEGYCTTTMEAKILHKPIVTTDAPGMREQFVSGENGLIVDEMTPEALYAGIKTLLDHPELQRKFIDNLSKESFDNTGELQKLYDFIES